MNSKFPIVAGLFEIALACICMLFSSIFVIVLLTWPQPVSLPILSIIVVGFVAFTFGLMGGIVALKRKRFALALIGACFIMCWGILWGWLTVSTLRSYEPLSLSDPWFQGVIITTTSILFSIITLAFLLASRTEFT